MKAVGKAFYLIRADTTLSTKMCVATWHTSMLKEHTRCNTVSADIAACVAVMSSDAQTVRADVLATRSSARSHHMLSVRAKPLIPLPEHRQRAAIFDRQIFFKKKWINFLINFNFFN